MLGFLWWCIRWGFATVFFVGIMALAGYYVFNRAVAGGNYVEVPDIQDLAIEQAVLVLEESNLQLGKPEQMGSDRPPGTVIAQRPPAKTVVRSGRKVYPTVSAIRLEEAPNLVGQTYGEDLADSLSRYAFKLAANPARIPSDRPAGEILAQDPLPGAKGLAKDSEIHLLVSDGPSQNLLLMPDLDSRDVSEAQRMLESLGLTAETQTMDAPDMPFNVVLDQSPKAGTWVSAGVKVVLAVRAQEEPRPEVRVRKKELRYVVPFSWTDRRVRFEFVPESGERKVVEHVVKGGETYPLSVPFETRVNEITVNVYIVDSEHPQGRKDKSYYFRGDAPALETSFPP